MARRRTVPRRLTSLDDTLSHQKVSATILNRDSDSVRNIRYIIATRMSPRRQSDWDARGGSHDRATLSIDTACLRPACSDKNMNPMSSFFGTLHKPIPDSLDSGVHESLLNISTCVFGTDEAHLCVVLVYRPLNQTRGVRR